MYLYVYVKMENYLKSQSKMGNFAYYRIENTINSLDWQRKSYTWYPFLANNM
jgi:hypothetical protein